MAKELEREPEDCLGWMLWPMDWKMCCEKLCQWAVWMGLDGLEHWECLPSGLIIQILVYGTTWQVVLARGGGRTIQTSLKPSLVCQPCLGLLSPEYHLNSNTPYLFTQHFRKGYLSPSLSSGTLPTLIRLVRIACIYLSSCTSFKRLQLDNDGHRKRNSHPYCCHLSVPKIQEYIVRRSTETTIMWRLSTTILKTLSVDCA